MHQAQARELTTPERMPLGGRSNHAPGMKGQQMERRQQKRPTGHMPVGLGRFYHL